MKSHNEVEAERLKALSAYDILDTPSELEYNDLTALAAQICQTPIALISLLDHTRQWFKSKVGLTVSETPKSAAFCLHTIQSDLPLVVEDVLLDERFANNPLVTGEPNIRFYVGVPLIVPSGHRIGTLCVLALAPMQLTEDQIETLQGLARQVVKLLELRRTNRLLAERESILRSFFDSAPMMMGVVELLESDILHIFDNAETARLFGIKPVEMLDRRASEMNIPADYIHKWIAHYREAKRTHQLQKFEYLHETEVGQRWLAATVVTVEQSEEKSARFAYVVEDISDRKRAEAEILKSLEKERELNAFKTHFITMVSHEYRTPLATILSSLDLLEYYGHCSTEQEKEKYCQQIRTSIQRMTDLLNDVLTIEESEADKLIFNPEPLNLKQFYQSLVTELQGNIKTEHRILFAIEGQYSQAQMDKKLMRHIFSNLISNAVKYSPEGGNIKVKAICQDQIATFYVQDQGIGIPSEAIQNLFQSFSRANNVGNIPGSGLGLSIVKRLVESHAGSISVQSQLGIGTTFIVALPLQPEGRHFTKPGFS